MRAFICLCICFPIYGNSTNLFTNPLNFNSTIIITNERTVISSGDISYRNGDIVYHIDLPSNQIIASNKENIYVQDNDFNQVMIYENDKSFFLQDLLANAYETENFPCPDSCFKIKPDLNSSFKEALISFKDQSIDWIRVLDIKDERILIKFENFKVESSNITYVIPENYEIINND
tara:strand:- start:7697 stop:8224 length:528 start_codon:yes stop_codon:yes gene_type:complete